MLSSNKTFEHILPNTKSLNFIGKSFLQNIGINIKLCWIHFRLGKTSFWCNILEGVLYFVEY